MALLLQLAIAAMIPSTDQLPGAAALELRPFVRTYLRETTWLMWVGAVGSALAFAASPVLTIFVPLPAFLLPARLLDQHAAAMCDHRLYPLRQAGMLIKMIGCLFWGARAEVRTPLGLATYSPDPGTWRTS